MTNVYETEVWTTREGEDVKIVEMDRAHARNTIAMLERNAASIKFRTELWLAGTSGPQGEMAQAAFEAELDEMTTADPVEWLRETPLWEALQNRLSGRTGQPQADLDQHLLGPDPFEED